MADWRGPSRDGRAAFLPTTLPAKIEFAWTQPLAARGLGGVAATADVVIVSDRGLNDTADVFECRSAADGSLKWAVRYPAPGNLDYGTVPGATPLIAGGRVYLFGAFGHLTSAELASGKITWEMNLRDEFEPPDDRKWGTCSTPLLAGGVLVVNPGAKDASLAGLDPATGKVKWKTPGKPAGYGSFVAATLGGKYQVVGHDADSLGGWDPATGARLWRRVPDRPNDFNVPTPIVLGDKLLVTTENNGSRLFAFRPGGAIDPTPVAVNRRLAPDTHTPVAAAGRVFGAWRRLYCLDAATLKEVWSADDPAFAKYCALVATDERVLALSIDGELVLFDATADELKVLSRTKAFPDDRGVYAHPAVVGKTMYLRGETTIGRLEF